VTTEVPYGTSRDFSKFREVPYTQNSQKCHRLYLGAGKKEKTRTNVYLKSKLCMSLDNVSTTFSFRNKTTFDLQRFLWLFFFLLANVYLKSKLCMSRQCFNNFFFHGVSEADKIRCLFSE
jgi:hypothetical protein